MLPLSAKTCSQGIIKWHYLTAEIFVLTEKEVIVWKVSVSKLEAGRNIPKGGANKYNDLLAATACHL
jgi:hypothetical protein